LLDFNYDYFMGLFEFVVGVIMHNQNFFQADQPIGLHIQIKLNYLYLYCEITIIKPSIRKRKFKQWWWTIYYQQNEQPPIKSLNTKITTTYDIGNPDPDIQNIRANTRNIILEIFWPETYTVYKIKHNTEVSLLSN
jgi:hypothetical protein